MSVSRFYEDRFGMMSTADISTALDHIDQAHFNIAGLLDLSLEIDGAAHLNFDHLFSAVRGAIAMLALVEGDIAAIRTALSEAEHDKAAPAAPIPHEGGLSGVVHRAREGGLSSRITTWQEGGLGAYWKSSRAGVA